MHLQVCLSLHIDQLRKVGAEVAEHPRIANNVRNDQIGSYEPAHAITVEPEAALWNLRLEIVARQTQIASRGIK